MNKNFEEKMRKYAYENIKNSSNFNINYNYNNEYNFTTITSIPTRVRPINVSNKEFCDKYDKLLIIYCSQII